MIILDKGIVKLLSVMGSDEEICESARVSYDNHTKSYNIERNKKLINYLMKHNHTSPFEMGELKFYIKCPLFVARQWVRHRTANINEISGRYSILNDNFYVPELKSICKQSITNKQGRDESYNLKTAKKIQKKIYKNSINSFKLYNTLIEKHDLSRELARMVLPLNTYTEFYWKIDLHNLFHFIKLRIQENSQEEIRAYAEVILEIVENKFPLSTEAFKNYCFDNKNNK